MKYFSTILLAFAAILGIIACIIPFWTVGTEKSVKSNLYAFNVGSSTNIGLWEVNWDNVGVPNAGITRGSSGSMKFPTDVYPANQHTQGLIASRILSIISIVLLAITALFAFLSVDKIVTYNTYNYILCFNSILINSVLCNTTTIIKWYEQ